MPTFLAELSENHGKAIVVAVKKAVYVAQKDAK